MVKKKAKKITKKGELSVIIDKLQHMETRMDNIEGFFSDQQEEKIEPVELVPSLASIKKPDKGFHIGSIKVPQVTIEPSPIMTSPIEKKASESLLNAPEGHQVMDNKVNIDNVVDLKHDDDEGIEFQTPQWIKIVVFSLVIMFFLYGLIIFIGVSKLNEVIVVLNNSTVCLT